MSDVESLSRALMQALADHARQFHETNVDTARFGFRETARAKVTGWFRKKLFNVLAWRGYAVTRALQHGEGLDTTLLEGQLEGLASLHAQLGDDASKRLLVQLLAFRMLGHEHVVLPWGRDQRYLRELKKLERLVDSDEVIQIEFMHWQLRRYDLRSLGFGLRLFLTPSTAMNTFRIRQYEYEADGMHVAAPRGRPVIDCGGCWGDTALYFADISDAPVFTYEFVASNLGVLRRNLALNPQHAELVHVVENAVWSSSNLPLWVEDEGPGSRTFAQPQPGSARVVTLSIDDLVERERILHVGFIKMDIEGAEREALEGARRTIERDHPILAISVYHRRDDLVAIPRFISSLAVPYRLFLGHYTMHAEETVLFALPESLRKP